MAPVKSVTFPSGITVTSEDTTSNLCSTCHSGREAKSTIDSAIASNKLSFRNVHYLPAAAVRQGAAARVGYEYTGRTYAGPWSGHPGGDGCISCHSASGTQHTFLIADNAASCKLCHQSAPTPEDIRSATKHGTDYDGDGSASEQLRGESAGLASDVLAEMHAVVVAAGGPGICYDAHSYPYFFVDTNGNADCDVGEAVSSNGFKAWTAGLMKAAHNFQISQKDPGGWAHNFDYLAQLLIDSMEDLGGDISSYERP